MFDLTRQILLEVALKKSEFSSSLQNIQVSGGFLMNYNPSRNVNVWSWILLLSQEFIPQIQAF